MPYHRYTYAETTAQINLISRMAAQLQEQRGLDAEHNAARSILLARMKHEIDRLNNLRNKVTQNGKQVHDTGRLRADT